MRAGRRRTVGYRARHGRAATRQPTGLAIMSRRQFCVAAGVAVAVTVVAGDGGHDLGNAWHLAISDHSQPYTSWRGTYAGWNKPGCPP